MSAFFDELDRRVERVEQELRDSWLKERPADLHSYQGCVKHYGSTPEWGETYNAPDDVRALQHAPHHIDHPLQGEKYLCWECDEVVTQAEYALSRGKCYRCADRALDRYLEER